MSDGPLTLLDILGPSQSGRTWDNLPEIWDAYAGERAAGRSPFAAAVRVAARSDRLAQAFAVGYPAALERLLPGLPLPSALCATEAEGNSPRAIATTLREEGEAYRLSGTKTFVTFGSLAKTLIIVARAGVKPDGRPNIVVAQIPAGRDGATIEDLPPTPFVPEIRHARIRLDAVSVLRGERLPDDGYIRYVKPFRTIEDIHVIGATLGYLIGLARRTDGGRALVADMAAQLVALEHLLDGAPLDPRVHVALHGVHRGVNALVATEAFKRLLQSAPRDERERWERDKALLDVASTARDARFERAKQALG